ncbi:MAG TPA: TIGR01777 family oxidoreductase [Longimicrobium sp.]|nr:TIGR01777 family oxidoreductase [Longimicrobium sp.]
MRVAVTGSTGLVGAALVERLRAEGHSVLRLVRSRSAGADTAHWDPDAGALDAAALEGVDAVVHLAGENVGARWTQEKKRRIRDSRVLGTGLIARAVAETKRRPRVLVSASAVGWYGDRGDEVLTEESAPGTGWLAGVGREWEAAAAPAVQAGVRVVHPRFGLVQSAAGGALQRLLLPFRMGVGGPIGGGRQWMSWISREDAVGVLMRMLDDERLSGPVNTLAGASRNLDYVAELGRQLHRPALLPVPAFGLRLLFGEMADEGLLASQRCEPRRLLDVGHTFRHPTLGDAVAAGLRDT